MSASAPAVQNDWSTFVDVLRARAQAQPDAPAYIYLADGEHDQRPLTYAETDRWAQAVAVFLQRHVPIGGRALLVMPSGLEYVAGFFGCLYAGAVAVTAHTPRLTGGLAQRDLRRLEAIADDCQPQVVLTSEAYLAQVRSARDNLTGLRKLPWKAVDAIGQVLASRWRNPAMAGRDTAFLQYTSGSTAAPKGVVVSHANLIHNQRVMQHGFGHDESTRIVSWLPLFHDMGLIGQMLHACWLGGVDVFMSPQAFVERPARWLEAITRFRGESSLAPNFGYDLCVRKVTALERAALDLRSWRVAGNASEPVRAETLRRFAETFGACGFDPGAAAPAYGLAEGTLIVTAGRVAGHHGPRLATFSAAEVQKTQFALGEPVEATHERVGSGLAVLDELLIVDPDTRLPVVEGECGEIWIRGASVAQGYWQRPDETAATFAAQLADGAGPYLCTGDLGRLHEGELFVAGRIKDLIIVAGQNYYPQDIEQTVDGCHGRLRPGCGAALSVDLGDQERVVIVQEAAADTTPAELDNAIAAIRQAVASEHGLEVAGVVLLPPQTIWKTTSGKIQRRQCQTEFLHGRLPAIAQWLSSPLEQALAQASAAATQTAPAETGPTAAVAPTVDLGSEHERRVRARLIEVLGPAAERLERRQGFTQAGMDSAVAVALAAQLSQDYSVEVPPTWLFDFPTIATLAAQLAEAQQLAAERSDGAVPRATVHKAVETHARPPVDRASAVGDVAIIGMACRFPGAENVDEFWRNLTQGVNSVGPVPATRFHPDEFTSTTGAASAQRVPWAGLLSRFDEFDADFFGISPREARWIDPQQRLLLELCYTALETAGRAGAELAGSPTGVFLGLSQSEYQNRALEQGVAPDGFLASGNYLSMAPNRISYCLNLKGPSLAVDTACSSSLVAVHLALQSLRSGECRLAIAGGANALFEPKQFVNFAQASMLAADGLCKTFDQRADGYVRGEGVGVVVLKPLAQAVRDGDPILAVIKSSAVNQDGHTAGLTAPSGPAQTELLEQAYAAAGVDPTSVGYLEAHGTGTALGDPIELAAIQRAFAAHHGPHQHCAIGSVKTNIGHLEAAAGIAGLIKACLALRHGQLPPSLNLVEPNRLFSFDCSPFYLVDRLRDWPRGAGPRRVGVSAFGFGGANAHVVLEEFSVDAAVHRAATPGGEPQEAVLTLSARSGEALRQLAGRYADWLHGDHDSPWHDICFTAAVGRGSHRHRLAIVAHSVHEAATKLDAWLAGAATSDVWRGIAPHSGTMVEPSADASSVGPMTVPAAAAAWVAGAAIDWRPFFAAGARRVTLPTYPFQRQSYWLLRPPGPRPATNMQPDAAMPLATAAENVCAATLSHDTVSAESPEQFARDWVKAQLAAVLESSPEAISLDANFHELGLDSLLAVRAGQRMTAALGAEIEPVLLYTFPTVRQLAAALCEEHPAPVSALMHALPANLSPNDELESPDDRAALVPAPGAGLSHDSAAITDHRVAIIGLACRFPGAANAAEFWEVLRSGRSTVGPLPADRQSWFNHLLAQQGELTEQQRAVASRGGFLTNIAEFDAALFGISPAEARVMDPQQRLFLEIAWQAVESSGYAPTEWARQRTGVFVGATTGDYARYLDRAGAGRLPHFGPGNIPTMIANRVSFRFDWHGPSMTLDTACSSSLVAVHTACQSLLSGEADIALAGGVNLALLPDNTLAYAEAGMISPTGHCYSFDDRADGYVRGEGVAAIVLKPLAAALRDGDTIWAVIEGSAVNQDGHDKLGLTAPSPKAQATVLRQAYAAAGVLPHSVTCIEAHGSATPLGDPLEVRGLSEVFGQRPDGQGKCALGSVKSNLGHLEAAAGIAGLIKAVLALRHRQLPPTVHFQSPNRNLAIRDTPLFINDRLRPWAVDGIRRAGVSSFGAGGTNAHVVISEAPTAAEPATSERQPGPYLLVLSAHTPGALAALGQSLAADVAADEQPLLRDICWTAAVGRTPLACRRAIVVDDAASLRQFLTEAQAAGMPDGVSLTSPAQPLGGAALWQHWQDAIEPRLAALESSWAAKLRGLCYGAKFDEQIRPHLPARLPEPDADAMPADPAARRLVYRAAAEIFVAGIDLDFDRLLPRGRRIPLPGIVFERQRYWIDLPQPAPVAPAAIPKSPKSDTQSPPPCRDLPLALPAPRLPLDDCLRQLRWPMADGDATSEPITGDWLLFLRAEPWCDALAAEFRRRGARVTVVRVAEAFRHSDLDRYEIQPVHPGNFQRLRENLEHEGRLPTRILFAWPAAAPLDSSIARQTAADAAMRSLLHLFRAFCHDDATTIRSLHALTRGSQAVDGKASCPSPEQAAVWGWLRCAALEHPNIAMQCVDLPVDDAALGSELWKSLLRELGRKSPAPEVSLVPGARRAAQLAALENDERLPTDAALRQEGVYLVTGGLGGIGWALVGRLLTRYRARVAVLSRRALPPRGAWPQWLAEHPTDPLAPLVRQAQVWLEQGGELLSLAGDVASEGDVAQALTIIEECFGDLNGVFHAAGVLHDGLVRTKDWKTTRAVLRPKVAGAWALDVSLGERQLDFCLLFSSLAGTLGNIGQADYAAANRFLDSFAAWRSGQGKRTIAIALGPWAGPGMAAGAPAPSSAGNLGKLDPAVGLDLIERALLCPASQIAAAAWSPVAPQESPPKVASSTASSPPAATVELGQATPEQLEALLVLHVSRAMETTPERIDIDRPLVEMGVDSVLAVRLAQELGQATGQTFPRTLLYDFPTLRKLSTALARRFAAPAAEAPRPATQAQQAAEQRVREPQAIAPEVRSPMVMLDALVSPAGAWEASAGETSIFEVATPAIPTPAQDALPETSAATMATVAPEATAAPSLPPPTPEKPVAAPIAVIGLGGRFPMADNIAQFWQNLCGKVDAVGEVPVERWSTAEHYSSDRHEAAKSYSKWAALLAGIDQFDPLFFRIAPREAEEMDPQQRLLLEVAWESLETAGYAAGQLSGTRTGVFIGAMPSEYVQNLLARPGRLDAYAGTGTALSTIANRLSYFLNLRGPCLSIDTACSSSLVAVQMAVEALRSGQCEYALAGGTQAGLALSHFLMLSRLGALSPDGRCRAFDRGANGYVLGEGVGLLVLKRLDRALADGDHIWGVVRGAAVNHGGQAAGLTVPSFSAQAEVIRAALDDAGVSADTLSYIEAHGTGTALGDPIEIQGLCEAFRQDTNRKQFCALGSLKSNIGHLEPAAGVAGLIKVLLALKHRRLPATLHVREVNPGLELEETPFFVQDHVANWHSDVGPLRAGVSSFGFGGVNAHVIVEEAPAAAPAQSPPTDRPCHVALLSARSPAALASLGRRLQQQFDAEPDLALADICYSLAVGRPQHAVRWAAVVESRADLVSRLEYLAEGRDDPAALTQEAVPRGPVRVAWLLGGARHLRTGALADLFEGQPAFRRQLLACAAIVDDELTQPLVELLYGTPPGQPLPLAAVRPAAFALQYALGRLWQAWGVEPQWLAGDGLGEAVAACLAGAATVEALLPMIARQGRLLAAGETGLAMTVAGDISGLRARIANFSSRLGITEALDPGLAVVAGPADVIQRFARQLTADGFQIGQPAPCDAAHSPAANTLGDQLEALWRGVAFAPLRCGLVSSLAGQLLPVGHNFSTGYWREQMRGTAQLSTVRQSLPALGCDLVLDLRLGGGAEESTMVAGPECIAALAADNANWRPLLSAVARLSLAGIDVKWAEVDRDYPRRRVPLATYPFERQRYWIDVTETAPAAEAPKAEVNTQQPQQPTIIPLDSPGRDQQTADVATTVRQVLARVLHLAPERLDTASSFHDLGVDSLMAEDAAVQLGDLLGLPSLTPSALFEHPSIDRLTAYLQSQQAGVEEATSAPGRASLPTASATATTTATAHDDAAATHDIAIIGYFGQFPEAPDPEQLWQLLSAGRSAVGPMPEERWQLALAYDPQLAAQLGNQPPVGGFLNDIDQFDPAFFRLTAAEANQMDPRQRLFLEAAYRAVEQAGYADRLESTRTGVFVGCGAEDYVTGLPAEVINEHTALGGTSATLPSRVAYFFNLRGPCLTVDTACSSALVALHLAVQSLRRGECDYALAGAVHLHLRLTSYLALRQMGAVSADGVCRAFGADANGFVPAEGVGAVLLRPLADAMAAGERIYGVIRGTALNNDGRTNGLAAPNPAAQREVLAAAWRDARISPTQLSYIEAHGTGTPLGDPIEAQALTDAMQHAAPGECHCGIGSIKTNLGHADAAAGMASLVKLLLALEHEELPASLHAETLNPRLHLENSPLHVVRARQPWPRRERPRLAGISGFGFGGANVHIVLEEPPAAAAAVAAPPVAPAPFHRQRCWLSGWQATATSPLPPGKSPGEEDQPVEVVSRSLISDTMQQLPTCSDEPLVQHVVWRPVATPPASPPSRTMTLAFHTDATWQLNLVDQLRQQSAECVQVLAARAFHRYDARRYTLAPLDRAGYERILAELAEAAPCTIRVVHLWSCQRPLDDTWWAQHIDEQLTCGARSVLQLLAALAGAGSQHRWELRLVTAGAQAVLSDADCAQPLDAASWGLCRAAAAELAHVQIQAIDIPAAVGAGGPSDDDSAALLAALISPATPAEIGIRNGQTWQPSWEAVLPVSESPDATLRNWPIKRNGVYLITGGLGAIGVRLADWLVAQANAAPAEEQASSGGLTLILVGRTALPPLDQWPQWLADHPADDRVSMRIQAIERWEAAGVVVQQAVADVSSVQHCAALVTHVRKRFGRIDGVFHLAGIGGKAPLREMAPGDFGAVLQTKLVGAWALDRALADDPPAWFVSFSSLAGWMGNALQAHYSAASRFLDAFARWQTSHGRRGLSIAWGLWDKLGMAATETARQRGDAALDPDAALAALRDALLGRDSHYIISQPAPTERPAEQQPRAARATEWPELISQVLSETLGSPPLELDSRRSFLDYGVDSLLALKFSRLMSDRLGRPLPATLLFDYPNVETLALRLAALGEVEVCSPVESVDRAAPLPAPSGGPDAFRLSSGRLARRLNPAGQ